MKNNLKLQPAEVIKVQKLNFETVLLRLKLGNQKSFKFLPGQFMQVGLPGFGECPISITSNPNFSKEYFELAVRNVGELTDKIFNLKKGQTLFVRGPFGNGFPKIPEDKNLVLIAGGCGFIPLRGVLEANIQVNKKSRKQENNINNVQVFLGCKNQETLLFQKQYNGWQRKKVDLNVILEEESFTENSKQGFVTDLLEKNKLLNESVVFVCGPEVMYKFVVDKLLSLKVKSENIYLSLERRMHCGVGICQHCACGSKYVCKDGPVFSYLDLKNEGYFDDKF